MKDSKKAVQYFSKEALERSKKLSTEEIVEFLDNFRLLHEKNQLSTKSKLISLKISEDLLKAFKTQAKLRGVRYQTWIKELMRDALVSSHPERKAPKT